MHAWEEEILKINKNKLWVQTDSSVCSHYYIDECNKIIYKKYIDGAVASSVEGFGTVGFYDQLKKFAHFDFIPKPYYINDAKRLVKEN